MQDIIGKMLNAAVALKMAAEHLVSQADTPTG
jgi:hypothetical protein